MTLRPQLLVGDGNWLLTLLAAAARCAAAAASIALGEEPDLAVVRPPCASSAPAAPLGWPAEGNAASRLGRAVSEGCATARGQLDVAGGSVPVRCASAPNLAGPPAAAARLSPLLALRGSWSPLALLGRPACKTKQHAHAFGAPCYLIPPVHSPPTNVTHTEHH